MTPARLLLIPSACPKTLAVHNILTRGGWSIVESAALASVVVVVSALDGFALTTLGNLPAASVHLPVVLVNSSAVLAEGTGFAAICRPEELLPVLESLAVPSKPALLGPALIGASPAIRDLRDYVAQVSEADCNVLILGETGTGKEIVAESIHANSPRREKPFVCLNSAAIPDSLVESELFGHERGAFTGATAAQTGKLAYANQGTVFFDEIGDVGFTIQAKLLRAIESRQVYRLGGTRAIDLDVRIVAATNQDLLAAIGEKRFRRDLYYRLNVVRMDLPALRERREDIPLLVTHFFEQFNRRWSRNLTGICKNSMQSLLDYDWPGNVRELRNVIEALFASLPRVVCGEANPPASHAATGESGLCTRIRAGKDSEGAGFHGLEQIASQRTTPLFTHDALSENAPAPTTIP